MIKKISCILFSVFLVFLNCLTVQATTATANLELSSNTVKKGEIITITLIVNCEDGINGVTGLKYDYDKSVLELISSGVNDTNFVNVGDSTNIDLICNSSSKITKSNIYVFNFKIKENITNINETEFSTSDFVIDSDVQNNSEITINSKKITIKVAISEENENLDKKDDNIVQDTQSQETIKETTKEMPKELSKETSKEVSKETPKEYTKEISKKDKKEQTNKATSKSTKNTDTKKTNTTNSIKELPKTGVVAKTGVIIFLIIGISIICFIKYKRID